MQRARTKTFKSGNSLAVRLPKDIAFPLGTEVEIIREGDVVTLRPLRISISEMLENLRRLPRPDYVEVRDMEEIPERPGL